MSCTKSCDGGIKASVRECNNPAPGNMGNQCKGDARINNKACNNQKCPGNMNY